jgi:DNA modification methylase
MVVDPFCGSGNVGVAALRHNRQFKINDLNKSEAEKRITAAYKEKYPKGE